VHSLDDLACQTDKGIVLAAALVQDLRNRLILLPSLDVIERISSETITRGHRRIYGALNERLSPQHRSAFSNGGNGHLISAKHGRPANARRQAAQQNPSRFASPLPTPRALILASSRTVTMICRTQ
jgi:hypothetical protein